MSGGTGDFGSNSSPPGTKLLLPANVLARRCPVLTSCIGLLASYAMPGTDRVYGATRLLRLKRSRRSTRSYTTWYQPTRRALLPGGHDEQTHEGSLSGRGVAKSKAIPDRLRTKSTGIVGTALVFAEEVCLRPGERKEEGEVGGKERWEEDKERRHRNDGREQRKKRAKWDERHEIGHRHRHRHRRTPIDPQTHHTQTPIDPQTHHTHHTQTHRHTQVTHRPSRT
eukprot:3860695-Rhodomonas_salina.1